LFLFFSGYAILSILFSLEKHFQAFHLFCLDILTYALTKRIEAFSSISTHPYFTNFGSMMGTTDLPYDF